MRVVFKGVKPRFVRLVLGRIQNESGVYALGANRQLGCGPPANVALVIGPNHVQAGGVDFAGCRARLVTGVGAVEFVKSVDEWVFGFQKSPPHGNRRGAQRVFVGVVDQRAVGRAAQAQHHGRLAFDGNGLRTLSQFDPFAVAPNLIRVGRVHFFGHQVNVVVLEHGQAPAKLAVVAQQRHRVERLVVAIQLKAGAAQVRLVPDRGRRIRNMRVAREHGFAAGGVAAVNHPGVAAFKGGHADLLQRALAQRRQLAQALPVGRAQCGFGVGLGQCGCFDHALRMPVQVKNAQVIGPELVADQRHHRFGFKGGGKAIRQIARHRQRVLGRERALGNAQQIKFQRRRVAGLELVDAIQVGGQGLVGGCAHVQGLRYPLRVFADAQGAKQAVGVEQLGAEDFGQFAHGQAAHHFHLEQAVLGVDVAQRTVQIRLVLRGDVGHAALVVAHSHRLLQAAQVHAAVAHWLFCVQVPGAASYQHNKGRSQQFEESFHGRALRE